MTYDAQSTESEKTAAKIKQLEEILEAAILVIRLQANYGSPCAKEFLKRYPQKEGT